MYVSLFLVLLLPWYVENSWFFPFITGKNFLFRIFVEIAFASWVLLALYDRNYRPRFSWILGGMTALVVVMFFANLFGEYPLKSFWSNFERMDGYMSILHLYLWFVVLGSSLRDRAMWSYFFHTSLAVAVAVALYGLAQSAGVVEGRARIDSRLGNAAYMAVYMLFHIFILYYLAFRTNNWVVRGIYALIFLMFVYVLVKTGTRGTFIGFVGGTTLALIYIGIFLRQAPQLRKVVIGILASLVVLGGLFYANRDSDFVQNDVGFGRIANISLDDLTTRATIWGMAWEGVKERPILGWGQGNFNYVFNAHYEPSLHSQESWFDRVHNILFDWLIAGGILGALAYFSIPVAILFYLFWRPMRGKESPFSVVEQAVLIGLVAGYFAHNLVVFDNIVSYIFYGAVLGFIHSQVTKDGQPLLGALKINKDVVTAVITPIVIVVTGLSMYFLHSPGIYAVGDLIGALRAQTPDTMLQEFRKTIEHGSFANQEIREQMTLRVQSALASPDFSDEIKIRMFSAVEQELLTQIEEKPGDARLHVFISTFYRSAGQLDRAEAQLDIARSLSPDKQAIIMEQGIVAYQKQDIETAHAFFKEAHELAPEFPTARIFYMATLVLQGEEETALALLDSPKQIRNAARNQFLRSIIAENDAFAMQVPLAEWRIEQNPESAQPRVDLAVAQHGLGNTAEAITILEEAIQVAPSFATLGQSFIDDIKAGRTPGEAAAAEQAANSGS